MNRHSLLLGGGWYSNLESLSSYIRGRSTRSADDFNVGFRLVLKKVETDRALRGGSWFGFDDYCRCSCRGNDDPGFRPNGIGFRLTLKRTT